MLRIAAALAALFFAGAAQAEDARALLDRALAVADAHKSARYAFTISFQDLKSGDAKPYVLRFDPRRAEGARWTLLEPSEAALSKDEKKRLANLQKSDSADGALVYDGLDASAKEARLVSEDDATATFAGPIRDRKAPAALAKSVEMNFTLDKKGGYVRSISFSSNAPFKPNAVARIERMSQMQTYEPLREGGPALLRRSESIAAGEAMFKKFDSHAVTEYRDFEEVAAGTVAGPAPQKP